MYRSEKLLALVQHSSAAGDPSAVARAVTVMPPWLYWRWLACIIPPSSVTKVHALALVEVSLLYILAIERSSQD